MRSRSFFQQISGKILFCLIICAALPVVVGAKPTTDATAQPRYALLLVNTDYPGAALTGHRDDGATLSAPLQALGFEVTLLNDLDRRGMRHAVRDFTAKLEDHQSSIGLIYFTGYRALQRNQTYLLPAGNDPNDLDAAARGGLNLSWVLDEIKFAGNRASALYINAYDPPDLTTAAVAQDSESPLTALVESGDGITLVLSHPPQTPVSAALELQTHYRDQLVQALSRPSIQLAGLVIQPHAADAQTPGPGPWIVSGPNASVALASAAAPQAGNSATTELTQAAEPEAAAEASPEEAFVWEVTIDGNKPADYELFLETYPEGFYATQARAKLAKLRAAADPTSPASAQAGDSINDRRAGIIWDSVKDSDDPAMLKLVIQRFPNSRYALLAEQRIAELQPPTGVKTAQRSLAPQPGTQQPTLATPAPSLPAADNAAVSDYLRRAQQALQANRLTTPAADSTLYWAEQALLLEPDNSTALALLKGIVDKYLGWASSQFRRDKISRARTNVAKARKLSSYANPAQIRRMNSLSQQIRNWQAPVPVAVAAPAPPPEQQSQDTWGKVKSWFSQAPNPSVQQDPLQQATDY